MISNKILSAEHKNIYKKLLLKDMALINEAIVTTFQAINPDDYDRQTHYFHGRYENIYIDEKKIPLLKELIHKIREEISTFLAVDSRQIRLGFWLNAMVPGQLTTRHCHDDFDEELSGVYYVKVPERSGNLILYADNPVVMQPEEGMLVFFSPALEHEVSQNSSNDIRLSIGFNASLLAAPI